jgi:hypothetical protein
MVFYLKYFISFALPIHLISIALDVEGNFNAAVVVVGAIFSIFGVRTIFDKIEQFLDEA